VETVADNSLITGAQRGDAEAFCELCRLHEARLLRQAVYLCGDLELSEDLAQETLVAAWKSLRRYNGRCQFFTWLCAILLNRFRNFCRQRRPSPVSAFSSIERADVERLLHSVPDASSSPSEAAQALERSAFLRDCIRRLPAKHREVIYLRFYVDDSLEGIAGALGCSLGTVKSRLFNALEKLRTMRELRARLPEFQPAQQEGTKP